MEGALSEKSLTKLLDALDSNPRHAGEKYELLRRKLVKFFEWRGDSAPEDHADQTLDRASRRLHQGEAIHDLVSYCYGIAKLVLMEAQRHAEQQRTAMDTVVQLRASDEGEADSARLCLESCLGRLDLGERRLILGYYQGARLLKIQARKRLAFQLGISADALRIRTHRLRARLERCVDDCMRSGAG